MQLKLYQVDAFATSLFKGNPAAVVPLEHWLADALLLAIAEENNLAETVFFVPQADGTYHIRWFTPEIEMDLCGHATLAAAHVLYQHLGHSEPEVVFSSKSGLLKVSRAGQVLTLDFPAWPPQPTSAPSAVVAGIGADPLEVYQSRDYLLVFASEAEVRAIQPNQAILNSLDLGTGGIIVTAPGDSVDFVSRFFTPGASVFEDPVTGSAHCTLTPFWAKKLGKTDLLALQVSKRGGELHCQLRGDRIEISGQAITYLEGKIFLT